MFLPESPRALALDGSLAVWGGLVILKVVPALTAIGALVLIVLRIRIAVIEYQLRKRELGR